jgi:uncharacterized pyridoxamine 5'-phosphate oxidase family protein
VVFDYVGVLAKNPSGVFATHDGDRIRTRIFLFLFANGNRVYFCTSKEKPVYSQVMANPNVSFCTHTPNYEPVVSISGRAVMTDDIQLKTAAMDGTPKLKKVYGGPDNPMFALFYIDVEEVETFSNADGVRKFIPKK